MALKMEGSGVLRHIILKSFDFYDDAVQHFELLKKLGQYKKLLTVAPIKNGRYAVYMTEDVTWRNLAEYI